MAPLVTPEVGAIGSLDLGRILNRGMIPDHYQQEEYSRSLDAYVRDYLKEEVFDEGLTRNLPAFARFFGGRVREGKWTSSSATAKLRSK